MEEFTKYRYNEDNDVQHDNVEGGNKYNDDLNKDNGVTPNDEPGDDPDDYNNEEIGGVQKEEAETDIEKFIEERWGPILKAFNLLIHRKANYQVDFILAQMY